MLILAIFIGLFLGIGIYLFTVLLMGIKKVGHLPLGAIIGATLMGVEFLSPWYLAILPAVIGHYIAYWAVQKFKL